MDRQTLRDWVHRYNECGLGGLYDRSRRNGPLPSLSAEQRAKVTEWVEQGPDLERDGVVRWRCTDLQQRIMAEFVVRLHERTISKLLRRLGFKRLQPRPYHPKKDAATQEAFKKTHMGSFGPSAELRGLSLPLIGRRPRSQRDQQPGGPGR